MLLNCRVFQASPSVSAMIPVYGAADGGIMSSATVSTAAHH